MFSVLSWPVTHMALGGCVLQFICPQRKNKNADLWTSQVSGTPPMKGQAGKPKEKDIELHSGGESPG